MDYIVISAEAKEDGRGVSYEELEALIRAHDLPVTPETLRNKISQYKRIPEIRRRVLLLLSKRYPDAFAREFPELQFTHGR